MKTQINIFLLATVMLFLTFTSCNKKESDTTPPIINLISPTEGAKLEIGNKHGVHLDMELSDNESLSSYKIEIHNNFNGHEHKISKSEDDTIPFFFQKSWSISGQKNAKIHHHEIIIPENATPGNYHLIVYCTDEAGNESHAARNIILSSEDEDDEHHHEH